MEFHMSKYSLNPRILWNINVVHFLCMKWIYMEKRVNTLRSYSSYITSPCQLHVWKYMIRLRINYSMCWSIEVYRMEIKWKFSHGFTLYIHWYSTDVNGTWWSVECKSWHYIWYPLELHAWNSLYGANMEFPWEVRGYVGRDFKISYSMPKSNLSENQNAR